MKPHLLQVATVPNRSFSIRQEMVLNVNSRWHCHSEVEIVYFTEAVELNLWVIVFVTLRLAM
jgi:hypothetical protein